MGRDKARLPLRGVPLVEAVAREVEKAAGATVLVGARDPVPGFLSIPDLHPGEGPLGGILTALDPKTGKILKQGRLTGALDTYYSSPVAAAGKIFLISQKGKAAVVKAGADWEGGSMVLRTVRSRSGAASLPGSNEKPGD